MPDIYQEGEGRAEEGFMAVIVVAVGMAAGVFGLGLLVGMGAGAFMLRRADGFDAGRDVISRVARRLIG